MNLLKSLSAAALLARCLQALVRLAKAQERLACAAEQSLQIETLRAGIRPSKLQETIEEGDKEGEFELLELSKEEEERLAHLEREAAERGIQISEDADLEELLYPGGDGMHRAGEARGAARQVLDALRRGFGPAGGKREGGDA